MPMLGYSSISLRLRLLVAAAVAVIAALVLAAVILSKLFADHVEAREWSELRNHLNQLIGAIERTSDRQIQVTAPLADPRFEKPLGGLYWQIEVEGGKRERSRSLWDTELRPPADVLRMGDVHRHRLTGPQGTSVMAIETSVTITPETAPLPLRVMIAVDRRDVDAAISSFRRVLVQSLAVLGACLLGALIWQIRIGLSPLRKLHHQLLAVRRGEALQIESTFAKELAPLVRDLNALLARERREREHARERAADLAHGFKTPLAIQGAITRDLRRRGESSAANELDAQIELMSRHVSRELSRARSASAPTLARARVSVRPIVEQVVRALARISADRSLSWSIEAGEDVIFSGDENDLLEIVGNLAENASKWATTKIAVRATSLGGTVTVSVEDDGPGLPVEDRNQAMLRGTRLDERTDGHGLGMSIVAKTVESYHGSIELARSSLGGLAVTVTFPKSD